MWRAALIALLLIPQSACAQPAGFEQRGTELDCLLGFDALVGGDAGHINIVSENLPFGAVADANSLTTFTKPAHPAHPAIVVRRRNASGEMHVSGCGFGSKPAFATFYNEFGLGNVDIHDDFQPRHD